MNSETYKPMIRGSRIIGQTSSSGLSLILPLGWSSDWDGSDVGYPDISVVGYYCYGNINAYIDMDNGSVLELWTSPVEDESEEEILYACY